MTRQLQILIPLMSLILGLSGCLKTRAQLRGDSNDREMEHGVPAAPVQDVQPQGQYAIDEIKSEITRIEGRVEDLARLSSEGNPGEKEDLRKLETRVEQLEKSHLELVETIEKLQENRSLAEPQDLFKKAKSDFEDADYENAAEGFGNYLKSPKAKKVEDATFYRGESFFKLKQYKKAIVEYSKFPEKFSHSPRMPAVLYKIGLCFDSLKMKDDAKGFYQELIDRYPQSPEAKKVKKK